jgi:multiple sugar transport system permease protein
MAFSGAKTSSGYKRQKRIKSLSRRVLAHSLLIIASVLIAFPFVWMVTRALMSPEELNADRFRLIPQVLQWSNFREFWEAEPLFPRYFLNSFVMAVGVTFLQLTVACLAAYAFALIRFPGRNLLFFIFVSTLMIPVVVTYVPSYIILANLDWLDSFRGLIIPSAVSAFGIFLLRQGFSSVPHELLDAAKIDGAGHLNILSKIVLPLSKPVLVTFIIFDLVGYYNSYFWPLLITSSPQMRVLTVGLTIFFIEKGYYGIRWHLIMAANAAAILPLIALFVVAQRWFVEGVATTGLKR